MNTFEELEAWRKAREFRIAVSKLCAKFPTDEKFALTIQTKRSSRSVTNNIAEGFGRFHFQENIQFCRISRGSLTETLDHLIVALDECYITQEELTEMRLKYDVCLKILNGYISYLKRAKNE